MRVVIADQYLNRATDRTVRPMEWDLEENEIIYVNDILNLFGLNGKDKS